MSENSLLANVCIALYAMLKKIETVAKPIIK